VFIYHFNRLIRNRLLWGIFALLTVFAFVSVDSCVGPSRGGAPSVGYLAEKGVDAQELSRAESFVRGIGRRRADDRPPALVRTQAWEHLAALHTVARIGLAPTAAEVRQTIREAPAFSANGVFSEQQYRRVVRDQLGILPESYESYMGDQIALVKISSALDAAAWVSPMEVQDELAGWTDLLTVQYAFASNRFATAEMPVTDAELRALYDAKTDLFRLPDRVAVRYAAVSVSNFMGSVSVQDEDIEEYYDANANQYTRTGTNDTVETIPLSEVRESIVAQLKLEEARYAAGTNASFGFLDVVQTMTSANAFEKLAARQGLTVCTTELFSATDEVPGVETAAESDFRDTAFDLDVRRLDARYAVVKGGVYVYLLAAATNVPAHTPTFEQAIDRVRPMAVEEAREKAFETQTKDLRAAMRKAIDEGKSFAAAAAAQGLNASTSLTFAVHTMSRGQFPYSYAVVPAAIAMRRGELSESSAVPGGAVFVYLAERKAGDPLTAELLRTQAQAGLGRRNQMAIRTGWMAWNLAKVGYRTVGPAAAPEADSGTADAGASEEEE
jgi:hypothetical protein